MPNRNYFPITAFSGQFYAVRSASLPAGESPLPPHRAWRIVERLIVRPVQLHELVALSQEIRRPCESSAATISYRLLQHAFVSGHWSLIFRPRIASAPVFPRNEPVAEQIRTAKIIKTWVEMEVVDDQGRPLPNQDYLCMLPDGTLREGQTDAQGRVRFDGIDPGNCAFSLTKLSPERWRRG